MLRKRGFVVGVGLLGAVLVLGLGAAVALATIDVRPLIEFAALRMLDRRVSIGTLRIGWGNPLAVELTDLRLANASWGSEPDMLRIAGLSAEIDLRALLHGVLRYDKLRLEKSTLLLERGAGNDANWRFGGHSSSPGGLALIPKDRTQFPTLLDMALHDGTVTYRVPDRHDLRIEFHDLAIRSPGDDQTVTLAVDGAYNGNPARLAGETASFAVMREAATPFGANWSLSSAASTVGFEGTMTDPLNFDGVGGTMRIETAKVSDLFKFVGAELDWGVPLTIAGPFAKEGAHWQFSKSAGAVAKNCFDGTLILNEGGRGEADAVALDLAFARLDLKALFADDRASGGAVPISLRIEEKPGATVDARIAARRLAYGTIEVADFAIHASSAPGAIALSALSFTVASGRVAASGSGKAVKAGSHIAANFALSGGDAGELATLAGAAAGQIAGKLDGRVTVEMTGPNLTEALKQSRGEAVLAMTNGQVARDLVEKASTDLRVLFRTAEGWVTASCLLGVVELRDGIATLAELRMRTPETTLVGTGAANLPAGRLDMTIKADSPGSHVLALDVPLHIAGDFTALSVRPVIGSTVPPARDPLAGRRLPAEMQALVAGNPCRTE